MEKFREPGEEDSEEAIDKATRAGSMERAADYFEKYIDARFDSLERQFSDFRSGTERQHSEFRSGMERQFSDFRDGTERQHGEFRSGMERQFSDFRDGMQRQHGEFRSGMEKVFADFKADLRETVREAAANNARLVEMIQAEVHSQNERINSIEGRIDNLRWWILGTGVGVFVGMAGLVYALHQSNQQLISVLTQYILK